MVHLRLGIAGLGQRPRIASEVDTEQGGGLVCRQGPHQTDIVRCLGGALVTPRDSRT